MRGLNAPPTPPNGPPPQVLPVPWVRLSQAAGRFFPEAAAAGPGQRWDVGSWNWDLVVLADGEAGEVALLVEAAPIPGPARSIGG